MKTNKVVLALFVGSFSLFGDDSFEIMTLSADYLYPYGQFHHVESSCKALWSDLDLFLTHEPLDHLQEQWPHIHKKLEKLLVGIQKLVTSSEAATYLPDDIVYLMRLTGCVANKYRLVCEKMNRALGQVFTTTCFDAITSHLKELASATCEVSATDLPKESA